MGLSNGSPRTSLWEFDYLLIRLNVMSAPRTRVNWFYEPWYVLDYWQNFKAE